MYPTGKQNKTKPPHQPVKTLFTSESSIKSSFFKIASLVSLSNSLCDFSEFLLNIQIFFNTYYELGIIPCAEGTWSSESLAWQVDSLPLSHLGCPITLLLLLLLPSRFSRVRLCVTPQTAAHQAPASLRFSRREHWSGLPFSSPMLLVNNLELPRWLSGKNLPANAGK